MIKYLLILAMLSGCGATSSRARSDVASEADAKAESKQGQAHSDESKTSTMPVVINCIQINTTKHETTNSPCWNRSGDKLPGDTLIEESVR